MPHLVRSRLLRRVHPTLQAALIAAALITPWSPTAMANEVALAEGHPDRYVVKEGDTLWGIAQQFLAEPWHWPLIWRDNQTVANPHVIFPGDVLVMTDGGMRLLRREGLGQTVKLQPTIRSESLANAIPTIKPNVIEPFLNAALLINEGELDGSGYVTEGVDKNIALGRLSQFYARGIPESGDEVFQIFRPKRPLHHPTSGEFLGIETLHIGDSRMLREGDPAKMEVTNSHEEVTPGDRILAVPRGIALPHYFPHAPDIDVRGQILSTINGVSEVGPHAVVTVSLGEREGIEVGHVLRVKRNGGMSIDPVTKEKYQIPEESSGLLMVFRTFEKASYGIILSGSRSIRMLDHVVTP